MQREGSLASKAGVPVGGLLLLINGVDVSTRSGHDAMTCATLIQQSGRPLMFTMLSPETEGEPPISPPAAAPASDEEPESKQKRRKHHHTNDKCWDEGCSPGLLDCMRRTGAMSVEVLMLTRRALSPSVKALPASTSNRQHPTFPTRHSLPLSARLASAASSSTIQSLHNPSLG